MRDRSQLRCDGLFRLAQVTVTLYTANGELMKRQGRPFDVFLVCLANKLRQRLIKGVDLHAIAGRAAADKGLDLAQAAQRLGVLTYLVKIRESNALQQVLGEVEFLLHPETHRLTLVHLSAGRGARAGLGFLLP